MCVRCKCSNNSFRAMQSGERWGMHRRVKSTEEAAELAGPLPGILERYKNERASCEPSVAEMRGCIYDFCKDQHGSRYIQQKIATATPAEVCLSMLLHYLGDDVEGVVCALRAGVSFVVASNH